MAQQPRKIMLFFVSEPGRGETLKAVLYGRFSQVGFAITQEGGDTALFVTNAGHAYCKTYTGALTREHRDAMTLLRLSVTQPEAEKIHETCEACVKARIPFNLADLLLMYMPLRDTRDVPLFEAEKLNNAQAVILILRECLDPDHHLRGAVEGLHSRQTFVEALYDRIRPYATPVGVGILGSPTH